jgi:hypothetical protein
MLIFIYILIFKPSFQTIILCLVFFILSVHKIKSQRFLIYLRVSANYYPLTTQQNEH